MRTFQWWWSSWCFVCEQNRRRYIDQLFIWPMIWLITLLRSHDASPNPLTILLIFCVRKYVKMKMVLFYYSFRLLFFILKLCKDSSGWINTVCLDKEIFSIIFFSGLIVCLIRRNIKSFLCDCLWPKLYNQIKMIETIASSKIRIKYAFLSILLNSK